MMTLRTGEGPTLQGPDIAADPFPIQAPVVSRRLRRILIFASIGLGTYLAALVATAPAALVLPRSAGFTAIDGTIWNGQASMPGGARLGWRWAPLRSLGRLGFALDWQATGPGTDVAGRGLVRTDSALLEEVSGHASGALLAAIAPDLPFGCDMPLDVDLRRAAIGGEAQGFTGQILADAGTCRLKAGGITTAVPPLVAIAAQEPGQGSEFSVAPQGQRRRRLVEGSISPEGHLRLRVTQAGAETLPFASTPGGLVLETNL